MNFIHVRDYGLPQALLPFAPVFYLFRGVFGLSRHANSRYTVRLAYRVPHYGKNQCISLY